MTIIKSILAAAVLTFTAASANAHDYVKHSSQISQPNHWDSKLAAPFSRDENDRFSQ